LAKSEVSDKKLIQRFQNGRDKDALGTLFLRYMELVYGVCLKYLGQPEAAQDAVMDIYEHLNRKLPQHEVDNFSGWLYMMSKNHCLQVLRKKNKVLTVSLDDPVMQNGRALHQEDDELDLEITEAIEDQLQDCMTRLPEQQQKCISLFYFEKHSYADICNITMMSMDQVRSNIQNGRRNLKKCIQTKQKFGSGTDI
jgi:RNA polymerase sigma-70 factor (ECF subfamily)